MGRWSTRASASPRTTRASWSRWCGDEARRVAEEQGLTLVLVDGSPGIGCPVIASLTGADLVLAVTEPTVSGRHDLERVLQVVRQFRLPFAVCVNKADLNPELGGADRRRGVFGRRGVRRQRRVRPRGDARPSGGPDVVAYGGRAAADIARLWEAVSAALSPSLEGEVLDA